MTSQAPPGWPEGVEQISVGKLGLMGIDHENQLFWDGRRAEIRQRLTLSTAQKFVAGVVTVCAVLGGLGAFLSGLNDGSAVPCARGVHLMGCPQLLGATR